MVSNGKGCSSTFDRVPVALGDDIGRGDLIVTFVHQYSISSSIFSSSNP